MLKSAESLGFKSVGNTFLNEKRLGLLFLAMYALLSLVWSFLADAPWDDDCPTRFLNTRHAFGDPENSISVWNRPLFVLIFALPAQLGKVSVPIIMTLISTLGAWMLWRAASALKVPNAWLIIPFYVFQPFFFGTSRVALTEPLAGTLICAGFYFMVHKKWMWYALIGGLLPLARLEMSLVLILWVLPLAKEKQWKNLLWMALPLAAWNVAGGLIAGDFTYVFTQTFGADKGINRYGHTGFGHYFERYFYVTGPIVALLLSLGLALRARTKGWSLWIDGQFALVFLVYVLFSWKLSMGNAAGFLRNLVPLTPLAALIALDGYNRCMAAISGLGYEKRVNDLKIDRTILGIMTCLVMAITYSFFSLKLALHQHPVPEKDYSLLATMGMMLATATLVVWTQRPEAKATLAQQEGKFGTTMLLTGMVCALFSLGYTVIKEPPAASDNVERQAVGVIAKFYKDSEFKSLPTYVNHNWFFWAADLDAYDPQFQRVKLANLQKAPLNSVVIWEVHYATRLEGDVLPQYMAQMPQFVELLRVGHPNRHECVILYQNVGPDSLRQAARSRDFSQANPKFLPAITARAYYLMDHRQFPAAVERFDFALASVKNDPDLWYGRGFCMMEMGYYTEAIGNFQNAVTISKRFSLAWHHLGVSQSHTGDLQNALISLNRSILLNKLSASAYYSRGGIRAAMGDFDGAAADYTATIQLNPNHAQAYTDRAAAYSLTGQIEAARIDISKAAQLTPNEAKVVFVQGRIELQAGNKTVACTYMKRAYDLGLKEAEKFIQKNCDSLAVAPPKPN